MVFKGRLNHAIGDSKLLINRWIGTKENKMRERAYVQEVIDGDTFKTRSETMRLEEIDAPEINSEGGRKAKRKLEELILNKTIEYEEKARDDYGRLVVQVWINGRNINDEMADFIDRL